MWVPPDIKDPVVRHYPGRKSVGYFGAVRLRDGRFVYRRESERFNAQTCWDFFKQLSRASAGTGHRVVIIADNARYHHANLHQDWRDARSDRFALDFLLPYSSDLKTIVRVWKLVRRLRLHNRYFANLNEVVETVEDQFEEWRYHNDTLRRLCAII